MFISVLFFIFIRVDNTALQIVIRILLIPVIAGVSYEVLRWAGRTDSKYADALSKPGLWLQRLTTKEPDAKMIEVAIQAVEAIFDWKAFLNEYYQDSENPEADMEASEAELAISANLIIDEKKDSRSLHPEEITINRYDQAGDEEDDLELVEPIESVEHIDEPVYEQETFASAYEKLEESQKDIPEDITPVKSKKRKPRSTKKVEITAEEPVIENSIAEEVKADDSIQEEQATVEQSVHEEQEIKTTKPRKRRSKKEQPIDANTDLVEASSIEEMNTASNNTDAANTEEEVPVFKQRNSKK
jgi:hypothetical protein